MDKGLLRRMTAAALLTLTVGSTALEAGSATGVDMDDIRTQVAAVAAAHTAEDERAGLSALRRVLARGDTTFSVLLQQPDGSEVNLATGSGSDPAAPVVIEVRQRGTDWRSDPFVPVDRDNLFVLFRE